MKGITGAFVLLSMLLALGLISACATERAAGAEPRPKWLTALIEDLEKEPVANPPALVARYEYKGQVVYYLPPRCCDIWSNVYDDAGAIICHADGGFSGDGDGRCPDFFALRTGGKILWRDPRGAATKGPSR